MNQMNGKVMLLEGVIFTLLGLFAIVQPYVVTLSLEFVIGVLLIIAGVVTGYRSLTTLKDPRSFPALIGSIVALIAGVLLIAYPLTGAITLTLLLTVFFFVDGIARVVNSFQYRPMKGWGWVLFSGVVSILLAVLIFAGLPTSAIWVIGIYVGVYLLLVGISLITLSFEVQ